MAENMGATRYKLSQHAHSTSYHDDDDDDDVDDTARG